MSDNDNAAKPWGGRFSEPTDAFVERFTASVQFDQRLAREDIQGSLAHAKMLTKVGVLSGLENIRPLLGLCNIARALIFTH